MFVELCHRIKLRSCSLSTANFRLPINVKQSTGLIDANEDLSACGPGREHITAQLDWKARQLGELHLYGDKICRVHFCFVEVFSLANGEGRVMRIGIEENLGIGELLCQSEPSCRCLYRSHWVPRVLLDVIHGDRVMMVLLVLL